MLGGQDCPASWKKAHKTEKYQREVLHLRQRKHTVNTHWGLIGSSLRPMGILADSEVNRN